MSSAQYFRMGTASLAASLILLAAGLLILFRIIHRVPPYRRKVRKVRMPPQFYEELTSGYREAGDIKEALEGMLSKYPRGRAARRIRASLDYLENSRYRDYETALYGYVWDKKEESAALLAEILVQDLAKIRRLPVKERKENK